jgi:uncharacterized protein Smg (DUF494 family)
LSRDGEAALRALRMLADRLEAWIEGDELAFETLGERFEEARLSDEEIRDAVFALRSLTETGEVPGLEGDASPGRDSQRVLSPEERAALSPEAWGFLLALRRSGSLDSSQFEQVLDLLHGTGARPVDVDTVREIATRVALRVDEEGGAVFPFPEQDRVH